MTETGHLFSAPPDDGHRGARTRPGDVLVAEPESGGALRNPPLHRDPAAGPIERDLWLAIPIVGALILAALVLFGVYLP